MFGTAALERRNVNATMMALINATGNASIEDMRARIGQGAVSGYSGCDGYVRGFSGYSGTSELHYKGPYYGGWTFKKHPPLPNEDLAEKGEL